MNHKALSLKGRGLFLLSICRKKLAATAFSRHLVCLKNCLVTAERYGLEEQVKYV